MQAELVDVDVDMDADEETPSHAVDDCAGTVTLVVDISLDTRRVLVELDREIAFDAGQYMAWQLPPALVGSRDGVTRTYSMANPSSSGRSLEFHVRRTPGGACSDGWLFTDLAARYPGRFTYRPCLSGEEAEPYASGRGADVLAADHERLRGHVAYVCRPPAMVDAAMRTPLSKQLFPRDMYREEFLDESNRAAGTVRSPLVKR